MIQLVHQKAQDRVSRVRDWWSIKLQVQTPLNHPLTHGTERVKMISHLSYSAVLHSVISLYKKWRNDRKLGKVRDCRNWG